MSNTFLYIYWAALYVICGALGFIPEPQGFAWGICLLFSLAFFVPPAILVYRGYRDGDRRGLLRIRNICLIWLGMALSMLVLNIMSLGFSEAAGTAVYYLLIVFSVPMVCGQIWVISLFLWACLLVLSWKLARKGR